MTILSPSEAFGFKPGMDRKLADWVQLTAYFKLLGTQSERINYEEAGQDDRGPSVRFGDHLFGREHEAPGGVPEIQGQLADPRVTTAAQAKELIAKASASRRAFLVQSILTFSPRQP